MSVPPKAPPVYKPTTKQAAAPPVYSPQKKTNTGVQPKLLTQFRLETRPAPPVYRPQAGTSQMKIKGVAYQRNGQISIPSPHPLSSPIAVRNTSHTVQRMRMGVDPVDRIKAEIRQREAKKEAMADFAKGYKHLYKKPKSSPELTMVNSLSFGGNRSSASLISSASGDTLYVSEQHGGASKFPDEIWDLSGAEVVATDSECASGLHSEMQTLVQLLREWLSDSESYKRFGIMTAEQFLADRLRGGRATAKGKGCCQLCAAVLLKLGVNVAFIEPSKYEKQWQDPFEFVGLENPWF